MNLSLDRFESPLGEILLVFAGDTLRALDFWDYEPRMQRLLRLHYGSVVLTEAPAPAAIAQPLRAFFAGDWEALNAIRVETGGTAFQREVWAALRRIPAGQTVSYGRLAAQLGRPAASRAVGLANGANPVAIVVPCHRVIGANAALTGYGGGLARKAWLLAHENGSRSALPLLVALDAVGAVA
ncbi:methylated-DNA--[protein]-cysteine S-methyltransferase [Acidisoma cladoniae]|jgi:methylated-DNA-[protein]-cysteine S-methyltransferase|uniref:methylated-DNA--[protein]-cysteine S-methyltransferase n=1 Tax=Acidisoma cladoniae TaxID=3040935 RepID=UPI00254FAA70|nr:methylated-DNA--[protein]-cysteine S-methyltransferase [Acidisoma sp. PAMC 29798]